MELIYTIIAILCMCLGFYVGYKVGKDKELPKVPKEVKHPIKTIKDNIESNRAEKEQNEKLQELLQYGKNMNVARIIIISNSYMKKVKEIITFTMESNGKVLNFLEYNQ